MALTEVGANLRDRLVLRKVRKIVTMYSVLIEQSLTE